MNNQFKEFSEKVVMLTGATGTIGEAVAHRLAKMNAKLRLVCINRNELDRRLAEETVSRLKQETGNNNIEILYCDLSSLQDINRMVTDYLESTNEPLDVLINNAGVFGLKKRIEGPDGYELTLAINFIAPFALSILLLDRLKTSGSGRIINVASDEYAVVSDFEKSMENYNATIKYKFNQYAFTKLALILFTRALSKRIPANQVTVNAMHPGAVMGNMWRGLPILLQLRISFVKMLLPIVAPDHLLTAEESARTHVYLAFSTEVDGITGKYYFREQERELNKVALNDQFSERIWALGSSLTGLDISPQRQSEKNNIDAIL